MLESRTRGKEWRRAALVSLAAGVLAGTAAAQVADTDRWRSDTYEYESRTSGSADWYNPLQMSATRSGRDWQDYGWDYGEAGYYDPYLFSKSYGFGYYYDPLSNAWVWGYRFSRFDERRADSGRYSPETRHQRRITARVVDIDRTEADDGRPAGLVMRVRTDSGQTREIYLGDQAYVQYHLPAVQRDENIRIYGDDVDVNGRYVFKPAQLETRGGRFAIPDYTHNRVLVGRVTEVRTQEVGERGERARVAEVRTSAGRRIEVQLGSPEDRSNPRLRLEAGDEVTLTGYTRAIDGHTTFFIQEVAAAALPAYAERTPVAAPRYPAAELTVSGRVRDLETRDIGEQSRLVADVTADDGAVWEVDLGPRDQLRELDIDAGERVTVTGPVTSLAGRQMLHARRVTAEEGSLDVSSATAFTARTGTYPERTRVVGDETWTAGGSDLYSGEVLSLRVARFEGFDDDHVVATVRLSDGRRIPIDLGPEDDLDDLDLKQGAWIHVNGSRGTINNLSGIIAREVRSNGERVYVRHERDTRSRQQKGWED